VLVREAFDLDELAERYREFIASCEPLLQADAGDPLALTLRLSTRWLRIIRDDPRVPLHLLPEDWPALRAQELFYTLHDRHRVAAREVADRVLELAPADANAP
jgi:phenylacetic acid degradation operon negative regulatory protein